MIIVLVSLKCPWSYFPRAQIITVHNWFRWSHGFLVLARWQAIIKPMVIKFTDAYVRHSTAIRYVLHQDYKRHHQKSFPYSRNCIKGCNARYAKYCARVTNARVDPSTESMCWRYCVKRPKQIGFRHRPCCVPPYGNNADSESREVYNSMHIYLCK